MKELKFYLCPHCKNLVYMVADSGVNPLCCGEKMKLLIPGESDGAGEKHIPVAQVNGNSISVAVGSVAHPMLEEHFIQWVALESEKGVQIAYLQPGAAPVANFALAEVDQAVAIYEYCNLHGLWKASL